MTFTRMASQHRLQPGAAACTAAKLCIRSLGLQCFDHVIALGLHDLQTCPVTAERHQVLREGPD